MLATDLARGCVISFGMHKASTMIADTWEWGGTHWTPRDPVRLPTVRRSGTMVYDSWRQETLLFGGFINSTAAATDWTWDGESWTQSAQGIAPRWDTAGAFDSTRGRIVVFGGRLVGTLNAETWEYDGSSWAQRFPATTPPARHQHAMAYDEVRQRVVMTGGTSNVSSSTAPLNDTWEWDGNDWIPGPSAPGRRFHQLVYDAARQRVVQAGGRLANGFQIPETWEFDGSQWSLRATSAPFLPPLPYHISIARHPTTGSAVAFSDTGEFVWNGNGWALSGVSESIPSGRGLVACADTHRNRVVTKVGGLTSEWNGERWSQGVVGGPPNADGASMAFDSVRNVSVLFRFGQTWEWDGSSWTLRTPASNPPAREQPAMAFDAARGEIILFGGLGFPSGFPTPLNDTWTYDGSNWTQRSGGPPGRFDAATAYDPLRQRVVMFGGSDFGGLLGDTWEWNGTNWTPMSPATSPTPRFGSAMAFDATRNGVVMFGGGFGGFSASNQTWIWDGLTWSQITTSAAPRARYFLAMAFDPVNNALLTIGGGPYDNISDSYARDSWMLGPPDIAAATTLGTGCGTQPPVIGSPTPYLGNQEFEIEIRNLQANAPTAVAFGTGFQPVPIGPCAYYLQNAYATLGTTANGFGVASVAAPLPVDLALIGTEYLAQGFAIGAPGSGFLGIDFSPARSLSTGK